jgi:hypothetical protein
MRTKTFTLLVTIRDDGSAAAMNPVILAAAVKGALETGVRSFMLSSSDVADLRKDPLLAGKHNLPPVVSAEVDALEGDHVGATDETGHQACQAHARLRKGA